MDVVDLLLVMRFFVVYGLDRKLGLGGFWAGDVASAECAEAEVPLLYMTFTGSTEDVPFYKAALSVLRGRVADSHSSYPGFRGETWAYGFVGEHAGVNPLLAGRFGRATLAFIRLKAG